MADSSKTEKATPKKRRDARKKGNVFMSKDAVTVATLLTSFAILRVTAGGMADRLKGFFRFCFGFADGLPIGALPGYINQLLTQAVIVLAQTAGPLLGVTALMAIAATFAQTRLLFAWDSLKPKFSRVNPLEGFKKLFSMRSIVEALKGIFKISILFYIIYHYISGMMTDFANYLYTDLGAVCWQLFERTFSMVVQIVIAFIALAGFDFFYQWWDYERQLKMSKQEIKEEYKQMEGDPQVKGKIKELQRRMAQSRMMQQVPQADVVVRNPTHFAVALRYKPGQDDAPVVLAKGMDELALRIVRVAEENGVAVIENVPLARALYADAELGRQIPPALYGLVAEVLVYLYRIGGKAAPK